MEVYERLMRENDEDPAQIVISGTLPKPCE